MKTVTTIKKELTASVKASLYLKTIVDDTIEVYFNNQALAVVVKRMYNTDKSLLVNDMSVARIIRKAEAMEANGTLSTDMSGVHVKTVGKKDDIEVVSAVVGEDDDASVVTSVVIEKAEESAEAQAEAEPTPTKQVNPLAFMCKVALQEAARSDFKWCLNATQKNRMAMVSKERFGLSDEDLQSLLDKFSQRFTKQYRSTTLLSPELLAWGYKMAQFYVPSRDGIRYFVLVANEDRNGGTIYQTGPNYVIEQGARPIPFITNWTGDMDNIMVRFFKNQNLLLYSVR